MSASVTFYAVKLEAMDSAPAGVRKFIKDFFKEAEVFGTTCYVALSGAEKSPWSHMRDEDYEEGLSGEELSGCGVFTWLENHPELVFHYRWS